MSLHLLQNHHTTDLTEPQYGSPYLATKLSELRCHESHVGRSRSLPITDSRRAKIPRLAFSSLIPTSFSTRFMKLLLRNERTTTILACTRHTDSHTCCEHCNASGMSHQSSNFRKPRYQASSALTTYSLSLSKRARPFCQQSRIPYTLSTYFS